MRLTRHTDYALRCLTVLALDPERTVTAADIAERMRMSHEHLFKVIATLAALGYVETRRGRTGGVRLAKAASRIRVGAVVRDTEESLALVECFNPETNECPIAPACVLARTLERARAAFFAVLDEVTLEDLARHPRRLQQLLAN
jgi:Rrf2 family nitric oxide-sensitive transcriptional repressor